MHRFPIPVSPPPLRRRRGFAPGCAARNSDRARNPPPRPAYAALSVLPSTAWYFQTAVAPPRLLPSWTFLVRQNDPPAISNALASLRQIRCRVFGGRTGRPSGRQMPAAATSTRTPWLSLFLHAQHAPYHVGNPLPVLRLYCQLFLAACRDRVELRPAVVLRGPPLRRDPPLLQQPHQRRVHRSLVQLQHVPADLFDAPGNSKPMLPAQRMQRFQNHQIQRPLQHFRFLCIHARFVPLCIPKEATTSPLQCP